MSKINIEGTEIVIVSEHDQDYISLTDMAKSQHENIIITKWLSTKNTIEYLGEWEAINNPDFNYTEYGIIKSSAGGNNYVLSVKEWVDRTGAIGITGRAGRYGGTFAHTDIAFQFGMWISPRFQLLLVKEFQRLKAEEAARIGSGWDVRRFIAKANYSIQTDAIKNVLVPISSLPEDKIGILYAAEADLINYALFNTSSKEWKLNNPGLCLNGMNIRDYADTHQLIVLSNLESLNAELIKAGQTKEYRLKRLREIAIDQLQSLSRSKQSEHRLAESPNKPKAKISSHSPKKEDKETESMSYDKFNSILKGSLSTPPPKKETKK